MESTAAMRISSRTDLLAQVFRRAPHHKTSDEHRQDHETNHGIQAASYTAEDDFAQLHEQHRHHTPDRGKRIVHRVHRAVGGCRGKRRPKRRIGHAETSFLAFHIAPGLARLAHVDRTVLGKLGRARHLEIPDSKQGDHKNGNMRTNIARPWRRSETKRPKENTKANGNEQKRDALKQIA